MGVYLREVIGVKGTAAAEEAEGEVGGERWKNWGGGGRRRRRNRGSRELDSLNELLEVPVIDERIFPFRNQLSFQFLREFHHFSSNLSPSFTEILWKWRAFPYILPFRERKGTLSSIRPKKSFIEIMSRHWYQHIWDPQMLGSSAIQSFSFFSFFLEPIVSYRPNSKISNLTWLSCPNF